MNGNKISLISYFLISFSFELNAQGTVDALSFSTLTGASVIGCHPGGVGWSFTPTADIVATGIEASAPQFSFWQGSNQIMATFGVSEWFIKPVNSFTPIAPLFLSAGQTYFVSCQNSNFFDSVTFSVWGLQGADGLRPFSTSTYISQFASYYVSATGQWSPTTTPPTLSASYLFYGPNFQFEVVPEPRELCLLIFGFAFCLLKQKNQRRVGN